MWLEEEECPMWCTDDESSGDEGCDTAEAAGMSDSLSPQRGSPEVGASPPTPPSGGLGVGAFAFPRSVS